MNRALIFGCGGQDGAYLSELLLSIDYEVWGVVRRSSSDANLWRIQHLTNNPNFHIVEGDITDSHSVNSICEQVLPTEIYNLAAQSHVGTSFKQPQYTFNTIVNGTLNLLEWVKKRRFTKFFHASSSEMFGSSRSERVTGVGIDALPLEFYQNEDTPFQPCSPYACAKLAAHKLVDVYRKSYGLFACSAITYNHESYRRGDRFVTKKITKWFAQNRLRIIDNLKNPPKLQLGNILSCRDWLHAKDAVKGFHLMMNAAVPKDYVIASGKTHSIQHFLHKVIHTVFRGTIDPEILYTSDVQEFIRPLEVNYLKGDSSLIRKELGWEPKITLDGLIAEMVQYDLHKYGWGK